MSKREHAEQLVDKWLKNDFLESTRKQAVDMLVAEDYDSIESRFGENVKLAFGTAGLRARMGIGYDRMNTTTVETTTSLLGKRVKVKIFSVYLPFSRHI